MYSKHLDVCISFNQNEKKSSTFYSCLFSAGGSFSFYFEPPISKAKKSLFYYCAYDCYYYGTGGLSNAPAISDRRSPGGLSYYTVCSLLNPNKSN